MASLNYLSNELLLFILQLLPGAERVRCERVCRRLKALVDSNRHRLKKRTDLAVRIYYNNEAMFYFYPNCEKPRTVHFEVRSFKRIANRLSTHCTFLWAHLVGVGEGALPAFGPLIQPLETLNIDLGLVSEKTLFSVIKNSRVKRLGYNQERGLLHEDFFFDAACQLEEFVIYSEIMLNFTDNMLIEWKKLRRISMPRAKTGLTKTSLKTIMEDWRKGKRILEYLEVQIERLNPDERREDLFAELHDCNRLCQRRGYHIALRDEDDARAAIYIKEFEHSWRVEINFLWPNV